MKEKYNELPSKPNIEQMQGDILEFWKQDSIFEKSVEKPADGEIVFYDGPPFPTGKPHHGTVLVSFIKDMIARYQTMRGYSVPRIWGWDCHGLPIENQAETLLNIDDKNEIEKTLGIDKFNDKCCDIVSNNNESWREYVEKMARWVDYDGAYKTMDLDFMESVIWAFKVCYDKNYIYRDYRVTPYCMHCETSLSISDTRESDSTRMRQDRWLIAKFKTGQTVNEKPVYMLAWTTTPWTLPSNMCLAVGNDLNYAYVEVGEQIYIASKDALKNYENVFGSEPVIVKECKGEDLLGITYEPLFNYFEDKKSEGAFCVVSADYVGAEDGVGIVHTAPAFGEDDYWTCKAHKLPQVNPVDEKGCFTQEITDFYTAENKKNVIEQNPAIIKFLYAAGKAVADGTIEHNYPHCWRCKRPLIYKAMDAWYFDIGKIKDRLMELNQEINWIPPTVKDGRFGKWLENARDWNISRNRYWSTPIPIWECEDCGDRQVFGSIDEIEKAGNVRLTNLHRQYMDEVKVTCTKCGHTMSRIPEVLDCWFESGSVPFAQKHYPFENKEWFDSHFPSDFIVEYTGQIRCWFYYLHVLSVALFDKHAFKNCIVHGTILAKDGKKLSKSSKNYTDPMELMNTMGTDAFRLYLYRSNAMLIGDLLFDESGIQEAYQQIVLPYWNSCNFYISYANIDGFKPESVKEPQSDNMLDNWILAKLQETTNFITQAMDEYQVDKFVQHIVSLMDGLTNWYIRRSRKRFWSSGMTADKQSAYETLYYVLVSTTKLLAPVAPIMAEQIFKTLTGGLSVHLEAWPQIPDMYKNEELIQNVTLVQEVIYLARTIRNKNQIKNRQPLSSVKIALSEQKMCDVIIEFKDVIAEELNIKNVEVTDDISSIAQMKVNPNFNEIRARYPDSIPQIIKAVKSGKYSFKNGVLTLVLDDGEKQFDPEILLITYQAQDGQHVAGSKDVVVSLDLTITQELKTEGLVRDIIRNVQDKRKQLGCGITDTILLEIKGADLGDWFDFICKETLAKLTKIDLPSDVISINQDGFDVEILIKTTQEKTP